MLTDNISPVPTSLPAASEEVEFTTVLIDPAYDVDGFSRPYESGSQPQPASKISPRRRIPRTEEPDLIQGFEIVDDRGFSKVTSLNDEQRGGYCDARTGLACVLVLTVTVLGLALGLALGLLQQNPPADLDSREKSLDANEYLSKFAIFLEPSQRVNDSSLEVEESLLLLVYDMGAVESASSVVDTRSGEDNLAILSMQDQALLGFYAQGEIVRIQYRILSNENDVTRKPFGIGVRFNGNSDWRMFPFNTPSDRGDIHELSFALPMTCFQDNGACAKSTLELIAIAAQTSDSTVMFKSPQSSFFEFGWMCGPSITKTTWQQMCTKGSSCAQFFQSCQTQNDDRFERCVDQFRLDSKLGEWLNTIKDGSRDCLPLSMMEIGIARQCALVLGLDYSFVAAEQRSRADVTTSTTCDSTSTATNGLCLSSSDSVDCNSVVTSRLRMIRGISITAVPTTPVPTHSITVTKSPTNAPTSTSSRTTTGPSLSPTSKSTNSTPTSSPTASSPTTSPSISPTKIPTTRTPTKPCHPDCTCPEKDPCCCRDDGICAPDTCPDLFH